MDVTRHRDASAATPKYSRPLSGVTKQEKPHDVPPKWHHRPGRRAYFQDDGYGGAEYQSPEDACYAAESSYDQDEWAYESEASSTYLDEEVEQDPSQYIAGESDWLYRDVIDGEIFDPFIEEECGRDSSCAFVCACEPKIR